MAFIALLIAVVLIVTAIRNTHVDLISALGQDVPSYAIWAAAIFAVAVIGFIPGLKPVSRGLLALLVLVILLAKNANGESNLQAALGNFQSTWKAAPSQASGGQAGGGQASSGQTATDPLDAFSQAFSSFGESLQVVGSGT